MTMNSKRNLIVAGVVVAVVTAFYISGYYIATGAY